MEKLTLETVYDIRELLVRIETKLDIMSEKRGDCDASQD